MCLYLLGGERYPANLVKELSDLSRLKSALSQPHILKGSIGLKHLCDVVNRVLCDGVVAKVEDLERLGQS
jgi:hypothetical protein